MTFYDKFVQLCDERGLSKQRACQMAGLSGTSWIRWSSGSRPSSVSLRAVCNFFGVTVDSMVDDSANAPMPDDGVAARQEAFDRTELRVLFDAAKDVPASKIYEVIALLQKYKEESEGK